VQRPILYQLTGDLKPRPATVPALSSDTDPNRPQPTLPATTKEHAMSTLRATRPSQIRGTRPRTRVLALIAIGATALVLALTGADGTRTQTTASSRAQPRAHTPASVTSAAPTGAFLDPASHAFPLSQIPNAIADSLGYFRDPETHEVIPVRPTGSTAQLARSSAPTRASVLRSMTPAERRYVLGILALTPAQLRAAFGTDK
jgi:hypothetical protein